jgi:2-amino-4-hydroxy-6-hydroxymethyldihydropteridine diphosphokinase
VTTAYVALGSNLGDRLALMRAATAALEGGGIEVVARSPVFETPAVAPEPQPPFLNAVVRLETALGPRALLDRCLAIEATLGRERLRPLAPRTIDLDLLLHGSAVVDEPGLVVPHPRLLDRAFVRVPLALVAEPGLRHPVTGEPLDRFPAPDEILPFAEL